MKMSMIIVALTFLAATCVSQGLAARNPVALKTSTFNPVKRDYFAHIKPEHRMVLKAWLERKVGLRPAVEDVDSHYDHATEKIRRVVGESAQQFYAYGDFNDDGKEDFAVVLVDDRDDYREDCKRDVCSALAVFNGDFGANQSPAFYEEELDMIEYGYLAYDQKVKHRLYFGALEGYYFCSTLMPKGDGYEWYEDPANCGYCDTEN